MPVLPGGGGAPPSAAADVRLSGDAVPVGERNSRRPALLSPAARKAIRQRMLLCRQASIDRIVQITGASLGELAHYRRELRESELPDRLLQRGAGLAFARELPQGALLYLLVRAARPRSIIETGVLPGYSTAWMLAALDANGAGELTSLGPGSPLGRAAGTRESTVGQLVAPALRSRWTLALGNTEDRLREILQRTSGIDLFFYDNGPIESRARFELRAAWEALSERGILLAHRVDATPAWSDFCRLQGLEPPQLLDAGPPPMGVLMVRPR